VIDHGNGFVTEYGHASALRVSVGQRVTQGQVIMAMGSTGNSTGPHVHFSIIRNGVYSNPMNYLSGR
jgi:murein DD-endopeptidase MepM/ murein hydrolase activator NlpD